MESYSIYFLFRIYLINLYNILVFIFLLRAFIYCFFLCVCCFFVWASMRKNN